jgi:transposase-like protein
MPLSGLEPQLRKELAIAREERDILKKALGIFSSLRK